MSKEGRKSPGPKEEEEQDSAYEMGCMCVCACGGIRVKGEPVDQDPLSRIWSGGKEVKSIMKVSQRLPKAGFGDNPYDW